MMPLEENEGIRNTLSSNASIMYSRMHIAALLYHRIQEVMVFSFKTCVLLSCTIRTWRTECNHRMKRVQHKHNILHKHTASSSLFYPFFFFGHQYYKHRRAIKLSCSVFLKYSGNWHLPEFHTLSKSRHKLTGP